MSDRINSFTIVLDKDIKDEDAQPLIAGLKMFKGVIDVTPNVTTPDLHVALIRERYRINDELLKIIEKGI